MKARANLRLSSAALLPVLVACLSCSGRATPTRSKVSGEGQPKSAQPAPQDPRYASLPKPKQAPEWAPPEVDRSDLSGGLTLWHLEQGPLPLVSIQVVLPVGSSEDPPGKEGLTLLSADMLDEGAGRLSALELSDQLGLLATDYAAQTGVDYVLLSMNALSDNFEASLGLLAEMLLRPRLPRDEFERRQKHHIAEAITRSADPRSSMKLALDRVLFGDGYAGSPEHGTQKSLAEISLRDVKAHVRRLTAREGAHIIVAGNVSRERVAAGIDQAFAGWTGQRSKQKPEMDTPAPAGTAFIVDFPGAAQSALSVATRAGDARDPKFFDELVMNQKFGGSFTGRVNMNLREDKGYTYGAFAFYRRYDHAGYFTVTSNVITEKTAQSVKEIFSELEALCQDRPLSQLEVDEAKEGLLLGYPMEFSRVDSLGMKLASLPIYGRSADFWTTWPSRVRAVTLAQARQAATPYCDPNQYRVVIAGDRAKIQEDLQGLGLAIVVLDREGHVAGEDK